MKHELYELRQMQSLALQGKIAMTRTRIKGWIKEFGEEGVYVSFSGGKDSTVLLHIIREEMGLKNIPAVFVDTGLEYPEIREFVRTFENVVWLKPKMNFKQVIEKYGYPFVSKEISQKISEVKSYMKYHDGDPSGWYRWDAMNGNRKDKSGKPSAYNMQKWKFFIDAPFDISHKCCHVMKKNPVKKYEKETGRHPITAQMAVESRLRCAEWIKHGCNAFDKKRPISNPMSFWTEQDVLEYIKQRNIPICSVYGDIIEDNTDSENLDGQMRFDDLPKDLWPDKLEQPKLKTTGCDRTGCMFCGFGCHAKGDERFVRMKDTHPKQYEWIMKPWDEGGLGYKEVIDWINENGNMNIKY